MKPARYNHLAMERCAVTAEHMVELVKFFQRAVGLRVDGMLGPKTIALLMDNVEHHEQERERG